MKGLIPYNHKEKNINFGDRILVYNGIDFDNYGKVYRIKYVDMLDNGEHLVFGIYCKNIKGIIFPGLYLDHSMNTLLYIDRRPRYKRLFYNLFG